MSDIRFAIAARRGALLLFFLLFACAGGKEVERDVRSFEPRLTTRTIWQPCRRSIPPGYVVEQADCGPANISRPAVSSASGACDTMTADHSEATRMLASQASCTDAVIARLETLGSGRADGALLSDLSAAYYVRAQRRNRPADLLRALDAAGRAVAAAP